MILDPLYPFLSVPRPWAAVTGIGIIALSMMQLKSILPFLAIGGFLLATPSAVIGYSIDESKSSFSLKFTDVETQISPISTLFIEEYVKVDVEGIKWTGYANDVGTELYFITRVNGEVAATGDISLPESALELPSTISAGEFYAAYGGRNRIEVELIVGEETTTASTTIQAYRKWASIAPLIVIVIVALITKKVELSFIVGTFTGACLLTGTIIDGFKSTFNVYILQAITDSSHIWM